LPEFPITNNPPHTATTAEQEAITKRISKPTKEKNMIPRHQQDKTTGTKKNSKHKIEKKKHNTMTAAVQQAVCIATVWSGFHHHPMLAPHLTLPIQRGYRGSHRENSRRTGMLWKVRHD